MIDSAKHILSHRKTYYSQNGEDGVLEYILSKIPDKNGWCVEVGAWDGKSLSNTFLSAVKYQYRGIFIEGYKPTYQNLCNNLGQMDQCICMNNYVKSTGANSLDNIFKQTPLPKTFDLISIDIDGDDYHIWKSFKEYHPKVVIIEISIRDKPHVFRIGREGFAVIRVNKEIWWGECSTLLAMTELANRKGYRLVAQVGCNAIYVKQEYLHLFHKREVLPSEVFTYEGLFNFELQFNDIKNLGFWPVVHWLYCRFKDQIVLPIKRMKEKNKT